MRRWPAIVFLNLLCAGSALAQEEVKIPSLRGSLQIPGYWFKAEAGGPRPVVIGLHGCSGAYDSKGRLSPGWRRDARYYNAESIHFLVIDSFTPRGARSICEIPNAQRRVHDEDRREDVYAAIQWLAAQPGVDAERIVVHGRSHGGSAVLSVLDRTAEFVRSQPIRPRAAVSLYPGCQKFASMWRYEIGAPLLLLIGELDDWTPAANCVRLHERLRGAQKDADFEFVLYPDSHHGFDGLARVHQRKGLATRSGTATVGGNPEARVAAHQRTFEFLSRVFGEPLKLTHAERLQLAP